MPSDFNMPYQKSYDTSTIFAKL